MPTIRYDESRGVNVVTYHIVFVGPSMAGKTTNLVQMYQRLPQGARGELIKIDTEDERTLFFDQAEVTVGGHGRGRSVASIRYITVPGQFFYQNLRRVLLGQVDGVVFVADSDPARLEANRVAWVDTQKHLHKHGYWPAQETHKAEGKELVYADQPKIPLLIQANKRDLPNALDLRVLKAILDPKGLYPWQEAIATEYKGVAETFKRITEMVIRGRKSPQARKTGVRTT